MKKVGAVAPAVLISRFGVTLARSATLCAPSAFRVSASNCVTDAATSGSMARGLVRSDHVDHLDAGRHLAVRPRGVSSGFSVSEPARPFLLSRIVGGVAALLRRRSAGEQSQPARERGQQRTRSDGAPASATQGCKTTCDSPAPRNLERSARGRRILSDVIVRVNVRRARRRPPRRRRLDRARRAWSMLARCTRPPSATRSILLLLLAGSLGGRAGAESPRRDAALGPRDRSHERRIRAEGGREHRLDRPDLPVHASIGADLHSPRSSRSRRSRMRTCARRRTATTSW